MRGTFWPSSPSSAIGNGAGLRQCQHSFLYTRFPVLSKRGKALDHLKFKRAPVLVSTVHLPPTFHTTFIVCSRGNQRQTLQGSKICSINPICPTVIGTRFQRNSRLLSHLSLFFSREQAKPAHSYRQRGKRAIFYNPINLPQCSPLSHQPAPRR